MLTKADIGRRLWGPEAGGSENTVSIMFQMLVNAENREEFWRIFQLGWPTADASWEWRTIMKDFLDHHSPAAPFLDGKDKEFFDGLPGVVTVYRGCSSDRVRGLAWTTDIEIARQFARGHRQIEVPSPVVATAQIPKAAIYTVTMDRNEYEVVLNYRRLRRLKTEPYEHAPMTGNEAVHAYS